MKIIQSLAVFALFLFTLAGLAQQTVPFRNNIPVTCTVERKTSIGQCGLLAKRDKWFCDATQFLCLGQGRLDDFMLQQRIGHITQHGQSMARGAV